MRRVRARMTHAPKQSRQLRRRRAPSHYRGASARPPAPPAERAASPLPAPWPSYLTHARAPCARAQALWPREPYAGSPVAPPSRQLPSWLPTRGRRAPPRAPAAPLPPRQPRTPVHAAALPTAPEAARARAATGPSQPHARHATRRRTSATRRACSCAASAMARCVFTAARSVPRLSSEPATSRCSREKAPLECLDGAVVILLCRRQPIGRRAVGGGSLLARPPQLCFGRRLPGLGRLLGQPARLVEVRHVLCVLSRELRQLFL
eukprot:scaffold14091_cov121-Isochrysis_galbana.AAC.18